MSVRLEHLRADVAEKARKALSELENRSVPCVVSSTLRSTAQQMALFAQGRKSLAYVNGLRVMAYMPPIGKQDNERLVTMCDGVTKLSRHQNGRALDVVPAEAGKAIWPAAEDPRWGEISAVMKSWGFIWGGDWEKFPDLPHYEIA